MMYSAYLSGYNGYNGSQWDPYAVGGAGGGGSGPTTAQSVDISNIPTWGVDLTQTYPGSCVFMNMEIVADILGVNLTEHGLIDAYATETGQQPEAVETDGIAIKSVSDYTSVNNFVSEYFNITSISLGQVTHSIDSGNPVMGTILDGIDNNGNVYEHEVTIYSYTNDPTGNTTYNYINTATGTSQPGNGLNIGGLISISKK